jgi:hypothetical protein
MIDFAAIVERGTTFFRFCRLRRMIADLIRVSLARIFGVRSSGLNRGSVLQSV